ncbi:hypothetical protein L873DRAFT_1806789 [Choiromyces venosus 120613-1]|uniref:Uncharacterized protein n=1 Tax=Choiromyces venosus 120613-1 TaxID=1336337 RepID=A0A3N4JM12_9PEZI|nr:hypothetical protein L873DRAFT_1806789 [Choiromyces venosus 120613-1]
MCLGVSQGFRRGKIQGVGGNFGGLRVPPARCLPGRPGLPVPSKSQDLRWSPRRNKKLNS